MMLISILTRLIEPKTQAKTTGSREEGQQV